MERRDAPPNPRKPFASNDGIRARMQAVRRVGTEPEMRLRRALHRAGVRYRVNARPLPSLNRRADIVFRRAQVAVFVDGCFWHGCPEHGRRAHRVNGWYWPEKIARNAARDAETDSILSEAGWRVIRVWEHQEAHEAAAVISSLVASRSKRER